MPGCIVLSITRLHRTVNPKMFNIRYNPTVVVDARDSQLHQDYTTSGRLPHGIHHFWTVYTIAPMMYTTWYVRHGNTMIHTMVHSVKKRYMTLYILLYVIHIIYYMVYTMK
jgi:hypothetical protein